MEMCSMLAERMLQGIAHPSSKLCLPKTYYSSSTILLPQTLTSQMRRIHVKNLLIEMNDVGAILMLPAYLQVDDVAYTFWMAVFFLAQIAGFIVSFRQNDHGPYFDVDGWSYPVAKGSGKAIQVKSYSVHMSALL